MLIQLYNSQIFKSGRVQSAKYSSTEQLGSTNRSTQWTCPSQVWAAICHHATHPFIQTNGLCVCVCLVANLTAQWLRSTCGTSKTLTVTYLLTNWSIRLGCTWNVFITRIINHWLGLANDKQRGRWQFAMIWSVWDMSGHAVKKRCNPSATMLCHNYVPESEVQIEQLSAHCLKFKKSEAQITLQVFKVTH